MLVLFGLLSLVSAGQSAKSRHGHSSAHSSGHSHGHSKEHSHGFSNGPTPKKDMGHMLHLTDIHIDPYYVHGAPIAEKCHKDPNVFETQRQIRGRTNTVTTIAGQFGSPASGCDSPPALVKETFAFIKNVIQKATPLDFVILTGDSARHDNDDRYPRNWNEVKEGNQMVMEYLLDTFHVPVLTSLGNLDVEPNGQLGFLEANPNPTLAFYADLWKPFIPETQIETFKRIGSFVLELRPGLLGVSLNTLYLANINHQVTDCSTHFSKPIKKHKRKQPAGDDVLRWLSQVFKMAQKNHELVYISGHVPPSAMNFYPECYKGFASLMKEYSDVVVGHYYGHLNLDHFFFPTPAFDPPSKDRLVKRKKTSWIKTYFNFLISSYKEEAESSDVHPYPILVAPSVIPAYNPALRVLRYATSGPVGALLGYDQYYVDLDKWNAHPDQNMDTFYQLEYSTENSYQMADLSVSGWVDLASRTKKKHADEKLYDKHHKPIKKKNKKSPVSGKSLRTLLLNHMVVSLAEWDR